MMGPLFLNFRLDEPWFKLMASTLREHSAACKEVVAEKGRRFVHGEGSI